ncbi:MAG: AMP-binding protein [Acidimicrobiia bacterium]
MIESFATVWEAVADATPDATAFAQGAQRLPWRDFDDRAARLATALAERGVRDGTHVGLFLFNSAAYAEALFACLKLRAVPVNVNFRYTPAELAALLDNADAEALVYHREIAERVAAARPRVPRVRTLVEVDDTDEVDGTVSLDRDPRPHGQSVVDDALDFETAIATHAPAPRIERSGHDHLLWYTGGTTGAPKGVIWEHASLLTFGLASGSTLLALDPPATLDELARSVTLLHDDASDARALVTLVTTPLVHATAAFQLHSTLSLGGTVVALPRGRVDGDEVCATIERERVQVLSVVGDLVLARIINALERAEAAGTPYDLSSLLRVYSSGAMVQPATKDALHRRGSMTFYDSLGSSEGSGFGVAFTSGPGESTSGRFHLGANARVLDADDRDVEPGSGEAGLLAVSESTGIGYYNDPEHTAATFRDLDGRRYAVPGDWALLHDDGTITLLGRGSGCINTGGEKVWPEEVEEALKTHPLVADALVVGVPDDEWGETVAAVVAIEGDRGAPPTVDELSAWVGTHLARYKRPRRVVFVDEVQRSAIGKPDYRWAREQLTS